MPVREQLLPVRNQAEEKIETGEKSVGQKDSRSREDASPLRALCISACGDKYQMSKWDKGPGCP